MKIRIARKIFKAFNSLKPNYWNGYKGFTLCSFFTCKNPRVLRATRIVIMHDRRFPIPTKPIKLSKIQGTTTKSRPKDWFK